MMSLSRSIFLFLKLIVLSFFKFHFITGQFILFVYNLFQEQMSFQMRYLSFQHIVWINQQRMLSPFERRKCFRLHVFTIKFIFYQVLISIFLSIPIGCNITYHTVVVVFSCTNRNRYVFFIWATYSKAVIHLIRVFCKGFTFNVLVHLSSVY